MLKAVLSRATTRVAVVGGRTSCCPTVGGPAVCVRGLSSAQSNVDKKLRIQQEREIFFKEVIREKERALDAGELRPLMAENPIELLQMADEAIPEGTGYRGNKRKKQQRIRWAIIRKAHTVQREQRMAKHERDMEKRKGSVIRARMEALGIPLPPAAPATAST